MATNQLLRFAHGTLPNIISYAEWQGLPEVNKGFVSGIAKSANMNRVFAQGALASYVMGQAIVTLLDKDATLESDTFYEDFMSAVAKYVPSAIADKSIASAKIADKAITTVKLADGAVNATKIADGSVGTNELANDSVTQAKIASKAVGTTEIADGAVGSTQIADGSVGTNELANDAVTQSKIASKAVGTTEIADSAVGATQLGSNAVTNAKIANSAVTGAKIANSTISTDKLSQRASKQDIQNGTSMRVVCSDVVKQYFDVICPPGMFGFFHATDVPEGWLLCNGAAVSRTTYSRLFAKIGTKYGSGNGSSTFNLPNLNDRVLQGTTNTGNVGNRLEAALPNITGAHGWTLNGANSYWHIGGSGALYNSGNNENKAGVTIDGGNIDRSNDSSIRIDASRSSSIYKGSSLQPKALYLLPCIRY